MSFLEQNLGDMSREELVRLIKQVVHQEVPAIPAALLALDDADHPIVAPPVPTEGQYLTYDASLGDWQSSDLSVDSSIISPDGAAPGSSPTPTVRGGVGYLAVQWDPVTNNDLVIYEVHISTSSGFTPDATTLSGTTPGALCFIRKLPDGSALQYETDYYVKIIATDSDGSAAASAEDSAQLDPAASDDILAGAITAEHFEAVMAMASAMLAGNFGGTNVQMGFGVKDDGAGNPELDASFVGIRAYDGSGSTDPVFRVDASDGTVQVKGRIYFGANFGSRLTRNDMIQIAEQSSAAFATPVLEQSDSFTDNDASSLNLTWPATPTLDNELLVAVTTWDAAGAPTHTATGYTSIRNSTFDSGNGRQQFFRRAATADGSDDITVSFDKIVDCVLIQVFEFSGVDDAVDAADATSSGTTSPADTGTTGALTQQGLLLAAIAIEGNWVAHGDNPRFTSGTTPTDFTQIGDDVILDPTATGPGGITTAGNELSSRVWMKVASAGTHSATNTVADVDAWRGGIVSLKAKANSLESADPDTARIYTADVGGRTVFCIVDEDGEQRSVVMGKAGELWDMEVMSGTADVPSTAAHASANVNVSVTGVAVGDVCVFLNRANQQRNWIWRAEPFCTVANQISLQGFNADSSTSDPTSETYYFLVIHCS